MKELTAKQIYEQETGNICPSNQIAYHEWYIQYVKWLENKLLTFYNNKQ